MNLYLRYFDDEVVVTSIDDALDFLSQMDEIVVDEYLQADLAQYMESSVPYPKRYKVRQHSYFIAIKTEARTLEEFKAYGEEQMRQPKEQQMNSKQALQDYLQAKHPGWYEGSLIFKRVICIPETQKSSYVDTEFVARLRAESIQDCYEQILAHLRSRQDIDPRSQYPSIKGKNFVCNFVSE